MADRSLLGSEWSSDLQPFPCQPYYQEQPYAPVMQCFPPQAQLYQSSGPAQTLFPLQNFSSPHWTPVFFNENRVFPKGDSPREIRNKAEKQRRDKLNHSISQLAAMVPPVVASNRKIDKTGVLRLTAHYLRSHQYVFGDSINQSKPEIKPNSAQAILKFLNGFLLTTTYKGIIVVVSQNVQQYLGYSEFELLGQNVFNIVHEDDRGIFRRQLMPQKNLLGPNGELLIPDEADGKEKVAKALSNQKRRFFIRFKKNGQRSEPNQYVRCHVEGSLRKADKACRGYNRCSQMVRRARARGDTFYCSGNDVVFIGIVRPSAETFMSESEMESFRMEYRTRHSIDGQIVQCDHRIALVTGYMSQEVRGVNAMNFVHRDDVRWVIIALREMYDKHRLYGESCYRLMTKNGQFIYMQTRGHLEVDHNTRAVTSFVCTNTVVDEEEGRQLNKSMKKKFTLMVNNSEELPLEEKEVDDNPNSSLEDPKQLEKVILHLVTNLPSPQSEDDCSQSPDRGESSPLRLSIIPPKKERIVSAIEKIYTVFKSFKKDRDMNIDQNKEISSLKPLNVKVDNNVSPIYTKSFPQTVQTLPSISTTALDSKVFINNNLIPISKQPNIISNELISNANAQIISNYKRICHVSNDIPYVGSMVNAGDKSENETNKSSFHIKMDHKTNSNLPESMEIQHTKTLPGTSTGFKRLYEIKDDNVPIKKMVEFNPKTTINVQKQLMNEQNGRLSPTLEKFFDDALLYNDIDPMDSLEHSIDPSFADLLVSEDVHDILADIEEATEQ